MSNYVYKDVVPFEIQDMGYYLPDIKQGVPNEISLQYDSTGEEVTPNTSGILIVVSKSVWNSYKNNLSGSDFKADILLTDVIGIDGNNTVYAADLSFSSIACVFGEEYDNINYVTLLCIFNVASPSSVILARNTDIELTYLPTNTTFKKENIPCKTAGGRVIGRHVNWEGSVINFDQYGTRTNLFVPDAKFRNFTGRELSSGNGWTTQLHNPILNFGTGASTNLLESDKNSDQYFNNVEYLTDIQLQELLNSTLSGNSFKDDFTAKEGTDAILNTLDPNSLAGTYVRSLVPTDLQECNLPNIYELAVIWLESDNIDSIDTTINEFNNLRLGSPNRFNTGKYWSCTEIYGGQFRGLYISYTGYISFNARYTSYKVIPVLEL